jgi:hypothetical protein
MGHILIQRSVAREQSHKRALSWGAQRSAALSRPDDDPVSKAVNGGAPQCRATAWLQGT